VLRDNGIETGATNSAFLRSKGVAAYGLAVGKTEEEARAIHGNDERIETRQLGLSIRLLFRAVTQVASGPP
jgi:acetylornithine deacetylase/succinyl-diaminopimelate desuccinylase-like protein